ncbi:MAG: hypothetical protein GQ574_16605 [Crocinitomix sp.]|nr:hypothetical protein [Crocinitomix sp.]
MKSSLCFLIVLSILFACDSSSTRENNEAPAIIEDAVFPFDADLSVACNICLLIDSIDIVHRKIVYSKAMAEPVDSSLLPIMDSLNIVLEDWKTELKKETRTEPTERWRYRTSERIALELCLEEYPLDRLDSARRFQDFFEYTSYNCYTNVGELYKDIDTSKFKEADGIYVVKFKGSTIRNSPTDFPQYWGNSLFHYYEIRNYIEAQKEQRFFKITGKYSNQLNQIEQLMFDKQEYNINVSSSGKIEFLENDTTFQRLFKNYERAGLNEN